MEGFRKVDTCEARKYNGLDLAIGKDSFYVKTDAEYCPKTVVRYLVNEIAGIERAEKMLAIDKARCEKYIDYVAQDKFKKIFL